MVKAVKASATVEFTFGGVREAEAVLQSLRPEKILPKSTRCKVALSRRQSVLCLRVDAEDTAALRAALNSFLRWTMVAKNMIERCG
jgi:tRNA threonylcarbamoyladenosine modification (KEOPS) complex  Pcc1 subunit